MHGVLAWAGGVSTATGSAKASASGRCCEVIHVSVFSYWALSNVDVWV